MTPVGVFVKSSQIPEWKCGHCKNEFAPFSLEDAMPLFVVYVGVVVVTPSCGCFT